MTKLKLALSLAAVFALGNLSGMALAKQIAKRMLSPKSQTASLERRFKDDAKRLGLREDTQNKVRDSFKSHASQINALLEPHQKEIFHKLNQERLNRWKPLRDETR
jgi:hemerythrin-like domain-containing protein